MSIVEYHGGPITHHYLMKKSKSELASMYMDLLKIRDQQRRQYARKSPRGDVLNEEQILTLWLGAFRYYCGRKSYAVSSFCDLLIAQWPSLPERTRELIRRDLEEEFERDERARAEGRQFLPLGLDCDRDAWRRVRDLWGAS